MIIENTRKVIREACELLESQKTAVERAARRTLGELHDALLGAETQIAVLDVRTCEELLKINKLPDLLKRALVESVNRCKNFEKQIAEQQAKLREEQAKQFAAPPPQNSAPAPAVDTGDPAAVPPSPPVTSAAAQAGAAPESPQAVS